MNGTAMPHDVSDYAHPNTAVSATSRGWYVATLSGYAHTDYDYMRVHDVYELQHIAAQMNGRYMLAGNIDAGVTNTWNRTSNGIEGFHPIGGVSSDAKFMGIFDGVGHTIEGLYIRHIDQNRIGLFGNVNGSYIENVSLKGSHVTGKDQVGGIVGYALGGNIRNVSFSGTVDGSRQVGGILGAGRYFTIRSTYNAGTVSGDSDVGGFVGFSNHVPLWDVWNVGNVRATGRNIGGIAGHVQDSTIQNALHTGTVTRQGSGIEASVGGIVGNAESEKINHVVWKSGSVTQEGGAFTADAVGVSSFVRTTDVQECTDAQLKQTATYTDWKDEDDKAVVATEGGKGTPWRIYDGKTTPLLTGLMKGTKRLEKTYDGNVFATTDEHITLGHTGKNVGMYDAYSDQFGYDLIGGAAIKPKELTLGFTNGTRFDKTYDGGSDTATRTLTKGTHYNLAGFVGSDGADVELAGAVTGTYADKNAGKDKEVTFQNLALTGTGAGNYTIKKAQGVGTITPKQLTLDLVGSTRFDKTYDGNANVTQTLAKGTNYNLNGFVTGEGTDIELSTVTGKYADKNAAANKAVTFDGLTLTGTGAGNYTLNKSTLTGIGTIARRALTLGAVAAQSKTYDGTTAADTSKFHAALNNVVTGEENLVTATATRAAYNDKNVAAANAVSYTGVALRGTGAGNYTLAATTAQGAGTITPRALTLGAVASQSKTYDGTTAADASKFHAALNNVVAGEENLVAATAAGAAYNDKNVAAANAVSYTGVALTGTGAGNYSLAAATAQGAGTITKRALTLGTIAEQSKTYDGTTAADASKFRAVLVNTVEGDNVTAAAAAATFNDKNVAAANRIDYTGVALAGADAGNYSLAATTAQGAGTITRRALTLGAVESQSKTYDGNTSADASKFRATLGNTIAGDSVTAAATGATYNDKNVAAANRIDYTGVALAGADAGNYSLAATTAEGTGTITKRALTVGAVTAQTKTYDGTTAADAAAFRATLDNVVAGEENLVAATAAGAAYNDKNVAKASKVNYTGVALQGTGAGNYTIADTAQGAGTITQRALTLGTVESQSKTYDGTTSADASKFRAALNNTIAGDNVTAAAATATFNDKNVTAANRLDYTGVALAGADAGNYSLVATTAQGTGTIAKRTLTVGSVTAQTKTYDGTTAADTSKFQATLNNVVAGEENSVTATAAGATYNDKNVAGANKVSYTGVALTGTGAANYAISNTTEGRGRITPKTLNLALTGGARFDKTYDGNANVTQTLTKNGNYTLTNFVNGEGADIALAPVTGTYADKNAGTRKTMTFDGLTLTGTGAGNYVLNTSTLAGTGTIAHRDLTLTADAQSIVQGEALPSFTGHAEGFADGEDERVFGADGITFGTTVTNTDRPSRYDIIGRVGGVSDGVVGNYRIRQAAGNARGFTVYAAVPGGILASLVQNAAPRFDMGFEGSVYLYGTPRTIPAEILGFYRFAPARDLLIEGLRLD